MNDELLDQIDRCQISNDEYQKFSFMLKDPSQAYKFYWLEAIIRLLINGDDLTFEAIANEMILNAWYSVSQYHLKLGPNVNGKPSSFLELAVKEIESLNLVQFGDSAEKIREAIATKNKKIDSVRNKLFDYVPYRLLSPFLNLGGKESNWRPKKKVIEIINNTPGVLYKIEGELKHKKMKVVLEPKWEDFIKKNATIILGWIQYKKIMFIQARNPGVPSIPNKLNPPLKERDLKAVRELWKYVSDKTGIIDVYNGGKVDMTNCDVDHFIPWTYVCCDELWNLVPVDSSSNRSKSNNLPDWDLYFDAYSKNQYAMYSLIVEDSKANYLFEKCKSKNLYSMWANELLYNGKKDEDTFVSILRDNMKPIYDSAKILGYGVWNNN